MKTHYINSWFMKDTITLCGLKYQKGGLMKLLLVTFSPTCKNCIKAAEKISDSTPKLNPNNP